MVTDSSKDYGGGSILMSCEDNTTRDEVLEHLKASYGISYVWKGELVEQKEAEHCGYKNPKMYEYTPIK